ncbi:MAG: hypothetical protein IJH64_11745 [Oscillospiraceae bacterium]|nr:hypothetical protein [Oscillospiraceae bacterium]
MDTFELETMATELEADAKAIVTLVLDVADDPSGEDGNKLHAILKLAEDQQLIADRMSIMLAAVG